MRATISATLTPEAYKIYEQWSRDRSASARISSAIAEGFAIQNKLKAVTIQRDLYRIRCSKIQRLSEDIDAGIYTDSSEGAVYINDIIKEIWNTHPILVEQKTMEDY